MDNSKFPDFNQHICCISDPLIETIKCCCIDHLMICTYNINSLTMMLKHPIQAFGSIWPCTCIGIEYATYINIHNWNIHSMREWDILLLQLTQCAREDSCILNKILSIIASKWIMLAFIISFITRFELLFASKLFLNLNEKRGNTLILFALCDIYRNVNGCFVSINCLQINIWSR